MKNFDKQTLIKAFTFLNDIFEELNEPREINNCWQKLMIHMNCDGVEARNLLAIWKQANKFEF